MNDLWLWLLPESVTDGYVWSTVVVGGLLAVLVVGRFVAFGETPAHKAAQAIPLVREGFFQIAKIFFGATAPQYVLKQSRQLSKIFRLPLKPPGTPCFVCVCDARVARRVLEDVHSVKFKPSYELFDNVVGGPNFFTAEGHRWKHFRKSLAPAFANPKDFYPKIRESLERWIESTLTPSIQAGEPIDVAEEMQIIAIDVVARVGFECNWDPRGAEAQIFLRGLQITYLEYFRHAVPINLFRHWAGWLHPARRRAIQASNSIKDVLRRILQQHRERKAAGEKYNPQSFVALLDGDDEYANDKERILDMFLLFAGGYDTSSYSVSWILFELERHPHEQTKLRRALAQCKSDEEAWNCPALKHVVRESMRLNATAALGPLRQLNKDVKIPGYDSSLVLPKGSICVAPLYAIQRDADIYERPDEFLPSRWEAPSDAALAAYLPYSIGRRNCLGIALANAELYVITAELIRRYEFTVQEEGYTDYYVTLKNQQCLLKATPVVANKEGIHDL